MSNSRKPTIGFWIVVALVVLPVLYLLSFGVAVLADNNDWLPDDSPLLQALVAVYSPLIWMHQSGPEPVRAALEWYIDLWDW